MELEKQITAAFRLARRASEDKRFGPSARSIFRAIAHELSKAHGELAAETRKRPAVSRG